MSRRATSWSSSRSSRSRGNEGPLFCAVRLELELPFTSSLKDKRQTLRSLKDRLRRKNVSVVEADNQDFWQRATVELALAAIDRRAVEEKREEVRRALLNYEELAIIEWREEFVKLWKYGERTYERTYAQGRVAVERDRRRRGRGTSRTHASRASLRSPAFRSARTWPRRRSSTASSLGRTSKAPARGCRARPGASRLRSGRRRASSARRGSTSSRTRSWRTWKDRGGTQRYQRDGRRCRREREITRRER